MKKFSFQDRIQNLETMGKTTFDLAIIGGGITGAGVARDAASRGMSVALIEARDFAFGTSSRSSKLIHGGIRYLENLEFGLVFEALAERQILFEIAPHLVHPLRFILPVYKSGRIGMNKLGLGMWLYDALSLFEAPELHERLNPDEALARVPILRRQELCGAYAYSDAYMDDERLVIETLRSAAEGGAVCANYCSAMGVEFTGSKLSAVKCQDEIAHQPFTLRARHFISTVGPWTDELGERFLPPWNKILRPSKGVHLTLPRSRLGLNDAVVMADDAEERIVFCIPRYEMMILGTTDTGYQGDPAEVHTTKQDVDYLLNVATQYFPGARLSANDIVASYAGVRPLVKDQAQSEDKTSREHVIIADPRNITFVAGGKYTTYRHMAEQTVAVALQNFPLEKQVQFRKSATRQALNPLATVEMLERALQMAPLWGRECKLDQEQVLRLAERHGMEAERILNAAFAAPLRDLSSAHRFWALEAIHAIESTMCLNLEDFYLRRSHLFLARSDHGRDLMEFLSQVFASHLGWSETTRQEQLLRVTHHLDTELEWKKHFKTCPLTE